MDCGFLANGFTGEAREKMCQVFHTMQSDIGNLEKKMDLMIHKVQLVALKDSKVQYLQAPSAHS